MCWPTKEYVLNVYTGFTVLLVFYASCHIMEIMTSGTCVYLGFSPLKIHLAFNCSIGQNHIKWAKHGINTHTPEVIITSLSFCRRKGKQALSLCVAFGTQHAQGMVYTLFYKYCLFRDVLCFFLLLNFPPLPLIN